jgi:hypothetical protein
MQCNSMQCNAMQFRLSTNAYEVRIKDKIYTTMYKNIVNEDTLSHYILHRNTKEHEAFVLLQGQKKKLIYKDYSLNKLFMNIH